MAPGQQILSDQPQAKDLTAWHQLSLILHQNTEHHTNLQNTAHKSVIPKWKMFLLASLGQLFQLTKLKSSIHATSLGLTCKHSPCTHSHETSIGHCSPSMMTAIRQTLISLHSFQRISYTTLKSRSTI